MTAPCKTAMARSPMRTGLHWKPDWGCMRSAVVPRRFQECRPSSPWRMRSSSLASQASRWRHSNTPPRRPRHDFLLNAAVAYLNLLAGVPTAIDRTRDARQRPETCRLTAAFARAGQGNQADADRMQTEVAVRRNALAQATAQVQVASAALVELLNLPPDRTLVPEEPTIVPIELVSHEADAGQLRQRRLVASAGNSAEPAPHLRRGRATQSRALCTALAECAR